VFIDLTAYADAFDNALTEGTFGVVATATAGGAPDLGFKGSLVVLDRDHLAYWERTRGQHLANLRRNPDVAVMYFSRARGAYLRLYGRAELHEDGPIREQIRSRVPAAEVEMDTERSGIGVLIRVDRLQEAFGGVSQEREAALTA
jgi:hypothetical protein